MVTATLDQDDKLEAYNIDCETAQDMPSRFKEHINKVVKAPRAQPPSPTAKRLAEIQILAKNLNERSGIAVLAPHLLFLPEKLGGEKLIMEIREAVLSSEYLPPAPDHLVKKRWTKLSQSVADTAIGYLTAKAGVELKVSSALTIREERVVVSFAWQLFLQYTILQTLADLLIAAEKGHYPHYRKHHVPFPN
jgi:hypothetical protein